MLPTLNPHSMRRLRRAVNTVLLVTASGCSAGPPPYAQPLPPEVAPTDALQLVTTIPHDRAAYTQGLLFLQGALFESTGGYGTSSLRRIPVDSDGEPRQIRVPSPYFAEGITALGDRLYQLTWRDRTGFIYDIETLEVLDTFTYEGQGWGLTSDGSSLILSDGTNRLRYLDPTTFETTRVIDVHDGAFPIANLNELEWIEGEIWANVWFKDKVAVIDPLTGSVRLWYDLVPFLPMIRFRSPSAVANGIAYDPGTDRIFITGKLWPQIYVVRRSSRVEP